MAADFVSLHPQRPSRRTALRLAAGAFAAPVVLRPPAARAATPLVVVNWGGRIAEIKKEVFYDPFTKDTGIPIRMVAGPDLARIKAQVTEGDVEWDIVDALDAWVPNGEKLGLFEKIDDGLYDKSAVAPQFRRDYAAASYVFAGGIAYPTDRKGAPGQHPTTWPEFWDAAKIPGRRALLGRIPNTLELALMADGVKPKEVYPCDVERAFKSLDRIRPYVTHWINQTPQTLSLIQSNETDFSYSFAHRVLDMQKEKIPLGYSFKQNLLGVIWTTIIKGTKNKAAAFKYVEFTMRPERQIAYSNVTADASPYPALRDKIDPAIRDWVPDPTREDSMVMNPDWWLGKEEELNTRFKEWLLKS